MRFLRENTNLKRSKKTLQSSSSSARSETSIRKLIRPPKKDKAGDCSLIRRQMPIKTSMRQSLLGFNFVSFSVSFDSVNNFFSDFKCSSFLLSPCQYDQLTSYVIRFFMLNFGDQINVEVYLGWPHYVFLLLRLFFGCHSQLTLLFMDQGF